MEMGIKITSGMKLGIKKGGALLGLTPHNFTLSLFSMDEVFLTQNLWYAKKEYRGVLMVTGSQHAARGLA